jgi:hypothetical protein
VSRELQPLLEVIIAAAEKFSRIAIEDYYHFYYETFITTVGISLATVTTFPA